MNKIKPEQNVIPASEGWNLAIPVHGENNLIESIFLEPIIAWAIETEYDSVLYQMVGFCTPITVIEGLDTDDRIIQRPDGSFTDHTMDYQCEADVISEYQSIEEIKRNKRKNKL